MVLHVKHRCWLSIARAVGGCPGEEEKTHRTIWPQTEADLWRCWHQSASQGSQHPPGHKAGPHFSLQTAVLAGCQHWPSSWHLLQGMGLADGLLTEIFWLSFPLSAGCAGGCWRGSPGLNGVASLCWGSTFSACETVTLGLNPVTVIELLLC